MLSRPAEDASASNQHPPPAANRSSYLGMLRRMPLAMRPPEEPARTLVPDFVVPFAPGMARAVAPLFAAVGAGAVECYVDLLAAILLTLTRYEEVVSPVRDSYARRFPASASVAEREGLWKPALVDEYGSARWTRFCIGLVPGWPALERRTRQAQP